MTENLRLVAKKKGFSFLDYLLKRNKEIAEDTGINRTLFAACPNSATVMKAVLNSAKKYNAPIKFASTLNQVDLDGGYIGLTPKQFVDTIKQMAKAIHLQAPVLIAIDHGGPWLKDVHRKENLNYAQTMGRIKESFGAAIEAGYGLIHVDPTFKN
ncbi:MAG: class II D-tagatose-bisphosphate aldolase, non-catalytic subunit [Maribacter sp.]|nr:class II D-tagatose-bisphosphate aldolase, non-catalytic subunit [Maribacter sp.]